MTDSQWDALLRVLRGENQEPPPCGFIIDSPWLPNWAGISILDYFADSGLWLQSNLKAVEQFPDCWFLPGFWAEFGMATDTSPFGVRLRWKENEFPFPPKLLDDIGEIDALEAPEPETDGLLPFVLKRLEQNRRGIEQAGHKIRFAVSRGPLNIASFLLGNTEFLLALKTQPDKTHQLMSVVTRFIKRWLALQMSRIDTIDGVLILDDIVGFLGEDDFKEFALPYLKDIYDGAEVSVRFFHNDAPCTVSAPYLTQMGVNLFNFGTQITMAQVRRLAGPDIVLMGNIPPRDVLADGSVDDVRHATRTLLDSIDDTSRLIVSCGGGMPPNVPTENIRALLDTVNGL